MENHRKKSYKLRKKKQKLDKLVEEFGELENVQENSSDSSSDNHGSEHNLNDLEISTSDSDNSTNLNNSVLHNECCENFVSDSSSSEEEFVCEATDPKEIKELQEWIVANNVPHAQVDKLLKILKARLLPVLPKTTKTLLKCKVDLSNLEKMKVKDESEGEFIYLGIKNQLLNKLVMKLHDTEILELIFNIDGMSPFKSSNVTVWPILCKVFTNIDLYEPFTVAIYSGNAKPKYCSEYMNKFIVEINRLLQDGIVIQEKLFKVKIKFFVCDTPARSFLKSVVSHVAFNGCERCKVKGQKVDKVTVFLEIDAERRSDIGLRTFADPDHHTGASPLCVIEPPINLVSQFILDPMHLLYLGCTNRILEYLLCPSKHEIRLSATLKAELVRRTAMIQNDIPDEFPRKMRSTKHYCKYKAVEFKFFALYAAPVVMKKLLPDNVYNHLMQFTVGCRLLSQKNRNLYITEARKYFTNFVKDAAALYGSTFLSLNVHNLIHVCDDVEITGCSLSDLSAFSFESYLGSISAVLRSPTHIIAQYCRRLKEKETFLNKMPTIPPDLEVLVEKKNKIKKIKYKGLILSLKHPNNTVLLNDGTICEVHSFNRRDNEIYMEMKKYTKKESLFKYPCDSYSLNICEVSRLTDNVMHVPLEKIQQKFVKLQINFSTEERKRLFVVPLLH